MNTERLENSPAPAIQIMDTDPLNALENDSFHCSWEWHLARLSSVCSLIYPFAFRLSGGNETELLHRRFFASADSLAAYFGYSACQVRRGLKELEVVGFFQLIARNKFKPTQFRVLSHNDWASKHKGKCTMKVEFPWAGEGDPLGQSLWRMSGGLVKFGDFQVRNLRNLEVDENKIVDEFSTFWEQTGKRMKAGNVPASFYMAMKSASQAAHKCAA